MMLRRELRVTRGCSDRDPMWVDRYDMLPTRMVMEDVFFPEPNVQHNQHVMDYWVARLDQLALRAAIGRK